MNYRRVAHGALVIALLVVVGAFIAQAYPGLVGADQSLVVQSGSMEPTIGTGAVVFVEEASVDAIEEGDVVTYADDGGNLITHRVVTKYDAGGDSVRFETKGDANDEPDPEAVYPGDVVGVVTFSLPLIGYVVTFGNTPMGYLTLVVVPVVLLIFDQLWELYRAGITDQENE